MLPTLNNIHALLYTRRKYGGSNYVSLKVADFTHVQISEHFTKFQHYPWFTPAEKTAGVNVTLLRYTTLHLSNIPAVVYTRRLNGGSNSHSLNDSQLYTCPKISTISLQWFSNGGSKYDSLKVGMLAGVTVPSWFGLIQVWRKVKNLCSQIPSSLWSKEGLVVGNKPAKSPCRACSGCKVIKLYVRLHLFKSQLYFTPVQVSILPLSKFQLYTCPNTPQFIIKIYTCPNTPQFIIKIYTCPSFEFTPVQVSNLHLSKFRFYPCPNTPQFIIKIYTCPSFNFTPVQIHPSS